MVALLIVPVALVGEVSFTSGGALYGFAQVFIGLVRKLTLGTREAVT